MRVERRGLVIKPISESYVIEDAEDIIPLRQRIIGVDP